MGEEKEEGQTGKESGSVGEEGGKGQHGAGPPVCGDQNQPTAIQAETSSISAQGGKRRGEGVWRTERERQADKEGTMYYINMPRHRPETRAARGWAVTRHSEEGTPGEQEQAGGDAGWW